jgi:hypothetical protein
MPLNEDQQVELLRIVDSDLFKRAVEEVLDQCSYDVSRLLAPEAGIAMAQEKGMRVFVRTLRRICIPVQPPVPPALRNQLTRASTKPQQS